MARVPTSPPAGVGRNQVLPGQEQPRAAAVQGRLADVRLWRRARALDEIVADMNGSLTLDDPALVANYRLDETDGLQAFDASYAQLDADVRGMKALWGALPSSCPIPIRRAASTSTAAATGSSCPPSRSGRRAQLLARLHPGSLGQPRQRRLTPASWELCNGWGVIDSIVLARDNRSNNLGLTIKGPAGRFPGGDRGDQQRQLDARRCDLRQHRHGWHADPGSMDRHGDHLHQRSGGPKRQRGCAVLGGTQHRVSGQEQRQLGSAVQRTHGRGSHLDRLPQRRRNPAATTSRRLLAAKPA